MKIQRNCFTPDYGSIILEVKSDAVFHQLLHGLDYKILGTTLEDPVIKCRGTVLNLYDLAEKWMQPLENVFPTKVEAEQKDFDAFSFNQASAVVAVKAGSSIKFVKPRVFIPIFTGTNTDYDIAKAFENAGGSVDKLVIRNLSPEFIKEAVSNVVDRVKNSQIIVFAGDDEEPNGPGRFAAAVFSNPYIREAVIV